ncbi:MAG: MoaD/ThiS family protein [Candidatus Woesearchaeota archaeon]|jgi:sulfur carrier protein ThiS|nr:thiamine biosynthesis protein ThiS [archaeon]MDP6548323.1 MoaD/ThiS family protein [Candidatus Woesearchaeota archaeon]MDP7263812.1 MoaD/ThiS family protein [Candidatus Woesearchaeota archaeon]MDP7622869.1 MoaD/ThiS family protein [Candidatus Woesearchaeota archaeon]HJN56871.1 MoaD/ThiS family protein [Candidatus Woesearchaeota archaeon]|tara:strand:- start:50 stop:256 length:207 start_codon:yes stop_codon:yes gene_type:complete
MKLNVFYDRENTEKTIELADNSSVKDLLKKMKINPVTVIVGIKDQIVLEDEKLKDKGNIKIISVISGG